MSYAKIIDHIEPINLEMDDSFLELVATPPVLHPEDCFLVCCNPTRHPTMIMAAASHQISEISA